MERLRLPVQKNMEKSNYEGVSYKSQKPSLIQYSLFNTQQTPWDVNSTSCCKL